MMSMDSDQTRLDRRALLSATAAAMALQAGCSSSGDNPPDQSGYGMKYGENYGHSR